MILAVVKVPSDAQALARAAAATRLAPPDVGLRLAGTPPRILLNDSDGAAVRAAAEALEAAGFIVVTCEPGDAPSDRDRVMARSLELGPGGMVAVDGLEHRHPCPPGAIDLIQRGIRISIGSETVKTTERQFTPGRALMSGGLMVSKKVDKTSVKRTETREAFVVVQRGDGEPEIILYERRLHYRFLGPEMQPSSFGNLERTLARVRQGAPAAPLDDRVARPGFVAGLPTTAADPVDLALFLVRLTYLRNPGR